jgi:type IV secretion system protein VirB9
MKRQCNRVSAVSAGVLFLISAQISHADSRIREETYDASRVYTINAAVGCAAMIELERGEVIDPNQNSSAGGIGMGDPKAWNMSATGNRVFFKPKADSPQTNLIVASDRRTYVFDLRYVAAKGLCSNTTYVLRFSYPEVALQKSAEQLRREAVLAQAQAQRVTINTNYTWRGSAAALKPTAAWDDGRFTRLQYDHAGELPLFYKVLPDGTEALVNSNLDIDDPTIVVLQEVSRTVRVRLGNDVIEVINRGYKLPAFNRSGAGFPGTVREPGNGPLPGALPARVQPAPNIEPVIAKVSAATGLEAISPPTAVAVTTAKAVPVAMFLVDTNERTTMEVLRRWARIEKAEFSWASNVDYPLTARMRAIEATTFVAAVNEIRVALEGTRVPLVISLDKSRGLSVTQAVQESIRPDAGAIAPPVIATAPRQGEPASMPVSLFLVNANERTTVQVLRRWARIAKADFSWKSEVDYPLTTRMRAIEAPTFPAAVNEIRAALEGTGAPMVIALDKTNGLSVSPTKEPVRAQAAVASPVAALAASPNLSAAAEPNAAVIPVKTWDAPARKAAGVTTGSWQIGERKSLHAVVEAWAAEAGYVVDWRSKYDYAITDAIRSGSYNGTLQIALMQLSTAFGISVKPLSMTFTREGGKPLLRVLDA